MRTHRNEITGNGGWQQSSIAFNAKHISMRHVAGSGDISISFNGTETVTRKLSPVGGTYANEFSMEIPNAVSQYGVYAAAGHTVEVLAWL